AGQLAVRGEDTTLSGRMSGQDVTVLGRFEGDLQLRGVLRIGRKGRVKAVVRARAVEVEGEFDGEIRAASLVFGETARAKGTFLAERLAIREGALVDGAVNLSSEPPSREPAIALPPPPAPQPPTPPAPPVESAGAKASNGEGDAAKPAEPAKASEGAKPAEGGSSPAEAPGTNAPSP